MGEFGWTAEGHTGNVVYENNGMENIENRRVSPPIYMEKSRPPLKMGHVTIVNNDISEARKIAEQVKNT